MSRVLPIVFATIVATSSLSADRVWASPATLITSSSTAAIGVAQDDVAAKVKAALQADPELGSQAQAITVTGEGGLITLEGTAPSVQVRAKIGEFVKKMDGVTKVTNKMKLAKK